MEYFTIGLVALLYCSITSLSSKVDKILKSLPDNLKHKKNFPSLEGLIGKKIEIETEDDLIFGSETRGILKEFNNKWLVLEATNNKNKKEWYYYRLNDIISINIIK